MLISIIVPVYNASHHISHLIEMVLAQKYDKWQLILVNDGSKDNTLEVCQEYAAKDKRILVVNQPNAGPSAARNTGIKSAIGDWITFVDADDDLLDCFLESMAREATKSDIIDIVFAGYIIAEPYRTAIYTYKTAIYESVSDVKEAITQSNLLHRCCPWGKMFRRCVMEEYNILFDTQLAHSEDRLFVYDYLLHTRGMATTSAIGYVYDSTQSDSLKNKVLSVDKLRIRQQKLTAAAHRVINHYHLVGVELYPIAKHLIPLYATAIQGFYFTMGYSKATIEAQRQFYDECFDKELYAAVQALDEWIHLVSGNEMLQFAINRQFGRINSRLAYIDKKIAISKLLDKATGRHSKSQPFAKVVSILNSKIYK